MRKVLSIILSLIITLGISAQDLNKLKETLVNSSNKEEQFKVCAQIADFYIYNNLDSALKYIKKAQKISADLNKITLQAYSINLLGNYYTMAGDLDTAYSISSKAKVICLENNVQDSVLSRIYNDLGYISLEKENIAEALVFFNNSLEIDLLNNNAQGIVGGYSNLGHVYFMINNYERSLEHYEKAILTIKEYDLKDEFGYVYSNLGMLYYEWQKFEEAEKYFLIALKSDLKQNVKYDLLIDYNNLASVYQVKKQYLKAITYYNKALKIARDFQSTTDIALIFNNLGRVYKEKKDYNIAIEYFEEALHLYLKIGQKSNAAYVYKNISDIYLLENDLNESEIYAQKALKLCGEIDDVLLLAFSPF